MDKDKKANDIANQTEIPVNNLSQTGGDKESKINAIKNIPVKFLAIGVGIFIIAAIIIGTIIFTSGDSQSSQILSDLEQAETAFREGDFERSEQIIDESIAQHGEAPGLIASKIKTISAIGNQTGTEADALSEAMPYIEKANQYPADINAQIAAGYAYETAGEYEKALEYYTKATEIDPNSADAWFRKGHALEFLERLDEAYEHYDTAYQMNPDHALALMVLAKRELVNGNANSAIDYYAKASVSHTASNTIKAESLAIISDILSVRGAFEEALRASEQAVSYSPDFSPALASHGFNLALTGDVDQGINYLNKSISANPRIAKNYYYLAQAQRASGLFTEAINNQKLAISKVDNDNTIIGEAYKQRIYSLYRYELAKTYDMSGLQIDTVSILVDAVSGDPQLAELLKAEYEKKGLFARNAQDPRFIDLIN